MKRLFTILWLVILCSPAALAAHGEPPGAYDHKPFLQGLAGNFHKKVVRNLKLDKLSDLPLYQIDIELDAILGTFKLHQEVNYKNNFPEPLNELVFRTYPNTASLLGDRKRNLSIEKTTINGEPARCEEINPTAWRITLPEALEPGQRVLIGMEVSAVVPRIRGDATSAAGMQNVMTEMMGKQSNEGYGVFAHHKGIFNLGHFFPIIPARHEGRFDSSAPSGMGDVANFDVANYLIKMRVPKTMRVASSGLQVGEQAMGPGPGALKEIYLMGAALRDFAIQASTRYRIHEKKAGRVKLRAFVLSGREEQAPSMLERSADCMKIYSKFFGPYPYPEFDIVQAPLVGGAGGMEYPGMVTVAAALSDKRATGPMGALMARLMESTGTVEFVIAHEVAHQWFNVLVGSDSGRHPYMDEALANYAAVMYFEKRHGSKAASRQVQMELVMPYQLYRMMGGRDGIVDRPVGQFSSQLEYAAMVYGKGAMFFHFLRRALGKRVFVNRLRTYVSGYSFRRAAPADLRRSFMRGKKRARVKKLFERWLKGRHGDEDIGKLNMGDMKKLMAQIQQLQGFHNIKIDGSLDAATMRLFQQAIDNLAGQP